MAHGLFPLFLKMDNRRCLVVGAGTIAASKITSLLSAGARIRVVAPDADAQILELVSKGAIQWLRRKFEPDDLNDIFLVIAATSDPEVNRSVFEESRRRGILCNSVDDPSHCDFYFPAVVRRGDLQIAVSTAGRSPAFAKRLKEELDQALEESLGERLNEIGDRRRRILREHPASRERAGLLNQIVYGDADEDESPESGPKEK